MKIPKVRSREGTEHSQVNNIILVGELFFIEREREREGEERMTWDIINEGGT